MSFKEISIKEISNYKDPISLFAEDAIALAKDDKEADGLTIGWGGLGVLWSKPTATVYINYQRYSRHIFDNSDYFSICFFNESNKDAVKYFGTVSGRDEDKVNKCNLTLIDDPKYIYYEEAELVILCKKMGQSDFDINNIKEDRIVNWYKKDGVHTIYQGEIVKVLRKSN